MSLVGNLLVCIFFVAVAVIILKFDQLKAFLIFLAAGFCISFAAIAALRIWMPDLSAWWILAFEGIIIVVAVANRFYGEWVTPDN
jgi:hypothetical protein